MGGATPQPDSILVVYSRVGQVAGYRGRPILGYRAGLIAGYDLFTAGQWVAGHRTPGIAGLGVPSSPSLEDARAAARAADAVVAARFPVAANPDDVDRHVKRNEGMPARPFMENIMYWTEMLKGSVPYLDYSDGPASSRRTVE